MTSKPVANRADGIVLTNQHHKPQTPGIMNLQTFTNLFVMLRENLLIAFFLFGVWSLSGQPLSLSLTGDSPTCHGFTDGSVYSEVTGGVPPYLYLWNNGFSSADLTGIGAGNYALTVTDADGNTAESTITLTEPTALDFSVSINNICAGDGNVTATAVGGTQPYAFLWDDGQTVANATGLSPGQHCATVTDANGCQTAACEIIWAALSVEVVATDLNCATDCDASVTAVVSGGLGPYTFLWNSGATTQIVANQPAGTYTVTVTDANGCTAVGTNSIGAPPLLEVEVTVNNPPCGSVGTTGTATAQASGGVPPYKYFWSTGATSPTVTDLPPGSYYVVVTDAHNCQAVENFVVIQDGNIDISVSATPASGCGLADGTATAMASGGLPPYEYTWSNGATGTSISGLMPGTYMVMATDANGCEGTAQVTVGGSPDINLLLTPTDVSCGGASDGVVAVAVLSGTPPYTYEWSNGVTTPVNPGLPAGTYTVTVTDAAGCMNVGSLTIDEPPVLTISLDSSGNDCHGDANGTAMVTVSGGTVPYNYLWSNGSTSNAIAGLAAGNYSVTATDAHGCTATGSVSVSEPPAITLTLTPNNASCSGANAGGATASVSGGTPPFTYTWSNGQTGSTINNVSSGTYSVTATDSNGCKASGSVVVVSASAPTCQVEIVSNISAVGAQDGSAQVSASGGTPPYFYEWSNGQVTSLATGLGEGTYSVTVTDDNGCTTSCSVTFVAPACLGDFAWLDLNRDGCQDADEPGIHDVVIQLSGTDVNGNLVVRYDTSDIYGAYLFNGLLPGTYKISVDIPQGYVLTARDACGEASDSDIDDATLMSQNVTLSAGQCYLDLDVGIYLKCDNITNPGEIEGDETLCGPGYDAGPITEVAPPSGGYGNIEFIWMMTTNAGPFNPNTWTVIPGATGPEYDPGVLYETTYFARCARRECCVNYLETNIVVKTVENVAVADIDGPETVCVGETVTYTAANAGPGATYLWHFGPTASPSTSTQQVVDVVFNTFGVVNITLDVEVNGCQASNQLAISVTSSPAWCGNGLVIFGSTNEKGQVLLEWEMETLPGDWRFDIFRSKNGQDFEQVGEMVESADFGVGEFVFMDEHPMRGTAFYQVQVSDDTGTHVAQSNILSVSVMADKTPFLLFPNPFRESLMMDIAQTISTDVRVEAGVQTCNVSRIGDRIELVLHQAQVEG
ncbi:MAG: hypothetical protein D6714_06825, partial [Bacteroidetes bacterium]